MELINTKGGWFIFKFTRADYKRFGKLTIDTFLIKLRQSIPNEDRHYYDDQNQWQIRDKYRSDFDKLLNKHFYPNYQKTLNF